MSDFCLNTPVPLTVSGKLIHGDMHMNGAFGFDHIVKYGKPANSSLKLPFLILSLSLLLHHY